MGLFRWNWLMTLVRRNTNPIPEHAALSWKRKLSIGYMFIAWNVAGLLAYSVYNHKGWANMEQTEDKRLTDAEKYVKMLNLNNKNINVIRISGTTVHSSKIDDAETLRKVAAEREASSNNK